jgi:hypothetical protein
MKVWVFVEGPADRIALETLWAGWRERLQRSGWGMPIIPLDDKSRYFRKIGHHAAEKLVNNGKDLVVGLPDLYPNVEYSHTEYKHADLPELRTVQIRLVKEALARVFDISNADAQTALNRFYPSAMKHDVEVLLLAAVDQLRLVLGTSEALGHWRHPAEDQNQTRPPKYVVDELFMTKQNRAYRDTVHTKAVLGKVTDIKGLLYNRSGQLECAVFKATIDWIAQATGVPWS